MDFQERMDEWLRHGEKDKVNYINSLNKKILPSIVQRIQQNDRNVLKEIVLPKWLSWEMLFEWSQTQKVGMGRRCILCNSLQENGMDFNQKFICERCFLKIKNTE